MDSGSLGSDLKIVARIVQQEQRTTALLWTNRLLIGICGRLLTTSGHRLPTDRTSDGLIDLALAHNLIDGPTSGLFDTMRIAGNKADHGAPSGSLLDWDATARLYVDAAEFLDVSFRSGRLAPEPDGSDERVTQSPSARGTDPHPVAHNIRKLAATVDPDLAEGFAAVASLLDDRDLISTLLWMKRMAVLLVRRAHERKGRRFEEGDYATLQRGIQIAQSDVLSPDSAAHLQSVRMLGNCADHRSPDIPSLEAVAGAVQGLALVAQDAEPESTTKGHTPPVEELSERLRRALALEWLSPDGAEQAFGWQPEHGRSSTERWLAILRAQTNVRDLQVAIGAASVRQNAKPAVRLCIRVAQSSDAERNEWRSVDAVLNRLGHDETDEADLPRVAVRDAWGLDEPRYSALDEHVRRPVAAATLKSLRDRDLVGPGGTWDDPWLCIGACAYGLIAFLSDLPNGPRNFVRWYFDNSEKPALRRRGAIVEHMLRWWPEARRETVTWQRETAKIPPSGREDHEIGTRLAMADRLLLGGAPFSPTASDPLPVSVRWATTNGRHDRSGALFLDAGVVDVGLYLTHARRAAGDARLSLLRAAAIVADEYGLIADLSEDPEGRVVRALSREATPTDVKRLTARERKDWMSALTPPLTECQHAYLASSASRTDGDGRLARAIGVRWGLTFDRPNPRPVKPSRSPDE